jgi:hypothetical protein
MKRPYSYSWTEAMRLPLGQFDGRPKWKAIGLRETALRVNEFAPTELRNVTASAVDRRFTREEPRTAPTLLYTVAMWRLANPAAFKDLIKVLRGES